MSFSQFVILTPYQRQGHGCKCIFIWCSSFPDNILAAELYKAIYQYIVNNENIAELTVEDPAEAFEDLRDKSDLQMLLSNRQFMAEGLGGQESHGGGRVSGIGRGGKSGRGGTKKGASASKGKLIPPVDKVWIEKWRKELKIAGVSTSAARCLHNTDQHKCYSDNFRGWSKCLYFCILIHRIPPVCEDIVYRSKKDYTDSILYVSLVYLFLYLNILGMLFFLGNSSPTGEGGKTR